MALCIFLTIRCHVLTKPLHPNLTWLSTQESNPYYIKNMMIKLFTQDWIEKSINPHLTLVRFGTITIQMVLLSEEQLFNSRKERFANKNVYEKVLTLNKTVLNFLSNVIPNELIEYDNVDSPLFNAKIKTLDTIKKLRKKSFPNAIWIAWYMTQKINTT